MRNELKYYENGFKITKEWWLDNKEHGPKKKGLIAKAFKSMILNSTDGYEVFGEEFMKKIQEITKNQDLVKYMSEFPDFYEKMNIIYGKYSIIFGDKEDTVKYYDLEKENPECGLCHNHHNQKFQLKLVYDNDENTAIYIAMGCAKLFNLRLYDPKKRKFYANPGTIRAILLYDKDRDVETIGSAKTMQQSEKGKVFVSQKKTVKELVKDKFNKKNGKYVLGGGMEESSNNDDDKKYIPISDQIIEFNKLIYSLNTINLERTHYCSRLPSKEDYTKALKILTRKKYNNAEIPYLKEKLYNLKNMSFRANRNTNNLTDMYNLEINFFVPPNVDNFLRGHYNVKQLLLVISLLKRFANNGGRINYQNVFFILRGIKVWFNKDHKEDDLKFTVEQLASIKDDPWSKVLLYPTLNQDINRKYEATYGEKFIGEDIKKFLEDNKFTQIYSYLKVHFEQTDNKI